MRQLLILAAALATTPAHATLAEVATHLRAVRTMRADFTQTAGNGATLRGRLTLARPGRARFQYERAPMLVVADGRSLTFVDYKVSQVSAWPIRGTPLAILLAPEPDLARIARVVGRGADGAPTIEARDPNHPEYGTITLDFARDAAAPGGLRPTGWRVLDAQGAVTRVTLGRATWNAPVDPNAFKFRDPRPRRVPGKG